MTTNKRIAIRAAKGGAGASTIAAAVADQAARAGTPTLLHDAAPVHDLAALLGLSTNPEHAAPIGPDLSLVISRAFGNRDAWPIQVMDLGTSREPYALDAWSEADLRIVVTRADYLALRREISAPFTDTTAAILVEEAGRPLGARDVADVLGIPVLSTMPVKASVARTIDAGVLFARMPADVVKPAQAILSLGANLTAR